MVAAETLISQLFLLNQAFQWTTGIFGVLLVIIVFKTPAMTFLKAYLSGSPIAAVKRKDGKYHFTKAKYSEGVIWHPYGIHQLDPEGSFREKKSGCDFHLCLDSIGITLTEKLLATLKTFQKMGFKDIEQIEDGLYRWRKCNKCGFEGLIDAVPHEEVINKDEKTGKQKIKRWVEFSCPNPDCDSKKFTHVFPDLKFPSYIPLDPGFLDNYFKYNMNPRTNEIVTQKEAQNEIESERKKDPIKWFSMGFAVLLVLIGFMIVYIIITKDATPAEGIASVGESLSGGIKAPNIQG